MNNIQVPKIVSYNGWGVKRVFYSFRCHRKLAVVGLYKILISCPLRHMDFLNVLERLVAGNAIRHIKVDKTPEFAKHPFDTPNL